MTFVFFVLVVAFLPPHCWRQSHVFNNRSHQRSRAAAVVRSNNSEKINRQRAIDVIIVRKRRDPEHRRVVKVLSWPVRKLLGAAHRCVLHGGEKNKSARSLFAHVYFYCYLFLPHFALSFWALSVLKVVKTLFVATNFFISLFFHDFLLFVSNRFFSVLNMVHASRRGSVLPKTFVTAQS